MKKNLFLAAVVSVVLAGCAKDPEAKVAADKESIEVSYAGEVVTVKLEANYAWTAAVAGDVKVVVDPAQGTGNAEVTLKIEENLGNSALEGTVTFSATGGGTTASTVIAIKQGVLTEVDYGGYKYKVKLLADGNFWFVENLRFVPQGKEVSDDLSNLDNGIWYPVDHANKALTDNADTIKVKGYLYSAEAALGLAPHTVNDDNFTTYSGAKGLCPEGWHIPTLDELANLVGRVAQSKYDLKQTPGPVASAPYWDATAGVALISKANADGFNIDNKVGYINANATATQGTVLNVMNYILSSTAVPKSTDAGVFNNQFYGILVASTSGGSCNGACFNYRGGASVRCIKDHK